MFVQSKYARATALAAYQQFIRLFPGTSARAFVNSMPKAGTHLLLNILRALPGTYFSGHHLHLWDFAKAKPGLKSFAEFELESLLLRRRLSRIAQGHFVTAHFPYSKDLSSELHAAHFRPIYLYRDPREVTVSEIRYTQRLVRHPLHDWMNSFKDDVSLIRALIDGEIPTGVKVDRRPTPLRVKLDNSLKWLQAPNCLTIDFAEITGAVSRAKQLALVKQIAEYLDVNQSRLDVERATNRASKMWSPTYRRDRKRSWRNELSSEAAALLDSACEEYQSATRKIDTMRMA